ncbi:hypothetical protein IIV31_116R [Armadillidium vulgare iridescent virus]|uniref:DUF5895 domain-containing protein n=1 Tax=Armadillidium vulgare iridescent virus TaxID=72201 RepID=A0A068QKW1_9VIRU|nr:hypothetical protein IIV31_116R [Armadillidium vulgare iridescent virus]CCV02488.1 hypothetical protein IIV31_116R [Armadillidium vulgare iridescent virus]
MDFNFDSDDNIETSKTPSIKAISSGVKGLKDQNGKTVGAGLWIAHENADICRWKKNCIDGCDSRCTSHYRNVIPHGIDTKKDDDNGDNIVIAGSVIVNPRMIILQRSLLLKIVTKTGKVLRAWKKKESKEKDGVKDYYACVKRYLIIFVDEENNPLHEIPLQLTAKGCFQFEFDQQLNGGPKVAGFRRTMLRAYNESCNRSASSMNEAWYSMCVFVPTFQSLMRGTEQQMKACITTGFEKPTKDNWLSLCVGRREDLANKYWPSLPSTWSDKGVEKPLTYTRHIFDLYNETKKTCEVKGWWKQEQDKDDEEDDEHPEDDQVHFEEEVGLESLSLKN